jgi:hypothetical protein
MHEPMTGIEPPYSAWEAIFVRTKHGRQMTCDMVAFATHSIFELGGGEHATSDDIVVGHCPTNCRRLSSVTYERTVATTPRVSIASII